MKVMMKTLLFSLGSLLVITGCGAPELDDTPDVSSSEYLLQTEPDGAQSVIEVREAAKSDDDVVIVGRIGGSENPWVDGRAAFSIVDESLNACSDIPGDTCEKPWDYCCETQRLPTSTALVKVVDESGGAVSTDARKLLALKELDTVVVQGKAHRDAEGNLEILATGLFVRPKS